MIRRAPTFPSRWSSSARTASTTWSTVGTATPTGHRMRVRSAGPREMVRKRTRRLNSVLALLTLLITPVVYSYFDGLSAWRPSETPTSWSGGDVW